MPRSPVNSNVCPHKPLSAFTLTLMIERIKNLTSKTLLSGTSSERTAFTALLSQRSALSLKEIYQCHGVFADGYLVDSNDRNIPIEIKETLGWPQLMSACFQIVSLNHLKGLNAVERWIIYEEISNEWQIRHDEKAMDHANRCIANFKVGLDIKFMQLLPSGEFKHTGGVSSAA